MLEANSRLTGQDRARVFYGLRVMKLDGFGYTQWLETTYWANRDVLNDIGYAATHHAFLERTQDGHYMLHASCLFIPCQKGRKHDSRYILGPPPNGARLVSRVLAGGVLERMDQTRVASQHDDYEHNLKTPLNRRCPMGDTAPVRVAADMLPFVLLVLALGDYVKALSTDGGKLMRRGIVLVEPRTAEGQWLAERSRKARAFITVSVLARTTPAQAHASTAASVWAQ